MKKTRVSIFVAVLLVLALGVSHAYAISYSVTVPMIGTDETDPAYKSGTGDTLIYASTFSQSCNIRGRMKADWDDADRSPWITIPNGGWGTFDYSGPGTEWVYLTFWSAVMCGPTSFSGEWYP
jgi:hypothetical protein